MSKLTSNFTIVKSNDTVRIVYATSGIQDDFFSILNVRFYIIDTTQFFTIADAVDFIKLDWNLCTNITDAVDTADFVDKVNILVGQRAAVSSLGVAIGSVQGTAPRVVTGFNSNVPTSLEVLSANSPVNGLFISIPAAATTLGIASESINDVGVTGTGARIISVTGLDSSWNRITEIVFLSGQTKVVTSQSFFRVNAAFVISTGSGDKNEGDIHIASSSDTFVGGQPDTTLYQTIEAEKNLSATSQFSVRAGCGLAGYRILINTNASVGKEMRVTFSVRKEGLPEFTVSSFLVSTGSNSVDILNNGPVGEKTDVILRFARTGSSIEAFVSYSATEFDLEQYPNNIAF